MRELSEDLAALIASGSYRRVVVVDIKLVDETELHFGTQRVTVGDKTYLPRLRKSTGALLMSLTSEIDRQAIDVHNLDKLIGQSVAADTNSFDGAEVVLGVVFINLKTGETHYDAKLPGQLNGAPVDREKVQFSFISSIDAAEQITTWTVGEMFPYSDPVPVEWRTDPNDIFNGRGDLFGELGWWRGRYRSPMNYGPY